MHYTQVYEYTKEINESIEVSLARDAAEEAATLTTVRLTTAERKK